LEVIYFMENRLHLAKKQAALEKQAALGPIKWTILKKQAALGQ